MTRLVVDTSAITAILMREPGYEVYEAALAHATEASISAVSQVELGIVAMSRGAEGLSKATRILQVYGIATVDFTEPMAQLALTASQTYGKGRHPAALNFGDCCTYALAKAKDLPLLYKGQDFAQTDMRSALA